MQIANPIYDVVFKYLLDDNKIAKKLLSLIIDQEILELELLPTEFRSTLKARSISVYRLDFSAKIKLKNGDHKNVIIEIQKAKFSSDIMRFRKYLGGRYSDKENFYIDERGKKHAIPILTIYFLGHNLENITAPILSILRTYHNRTKGYEVIDKQDKFVESLTHDSVIIQVQRLDRRSQNKLEQVLSVFENSESFQHFLNINEEDYPEEYHEVIRRLMKAASETEVRQTMDVEDEIIDELETLERQAEKDREESRKAREESKKAKEQVQKSKEESKQAKEQAQKAKEQAEKAKEKLNTALQNLMKNGFSEKEAKEVLGL